MKIEIKSITGNILFSHECEYNSIKTTLIKAVECGADLEGADLEGADLRGADLRGANLDVANLRGADLRGAKDVGGRIIDNCFTIYGSGHSVVWFGNGNIRIGCHCKTIQEWKKVYKSIGEQEGYTNEQIEEYYDYILFAEKLQSKIVLPETINQ